MRKTSKPNPQKTPMYWTQFSPFRHVYHFRDRQHSQHGYSNLAKQPSWRSIMFCVYVQVHRSKTVAVFA